MSRNLADRVGAPSYAAMIRTQPELVAHLAASMAAFKATALVDLAGPIEGDPFARLRTAVEARALSGATFGRRFSDALRACTAEQLGEDRAAEWWALALGEKASRLYRFFLDRIPSRYPELIREARDG